MGRKAGRPKGFKKSITVSIKFEEAEFEKVKDIAALETLNTGRIVSAHQLIRDAVSFVYGDNERLRECFRRSRAHITKRY